MIKPIAALLILYLISDTGALPVELRSRIKTQQVYRTANIPSNWIYSIEVKRVESSQAAEVSRCWTVPRNIKVVHHQQLFRLSKGNEEKNRNQKVYEKLTKLNEDENIIEQFEIIGDTIFVITSDGSGYFISIANSSDIKKVETNLFSKNNQRSYELLIIKEYKGKVLLITRNKLVMCSKEGPTCQNVEGYQTVNKFRGAEVTQSNDGFVVFVVAHNHLITYELTADTKLKNKKEYDNAFFGVQKVSLRSLVKVNKDTIYLLDSYRGVWDLVAAESWSQNITVKKKLVFEQFGCYQMIEQNQGESLILTCNPSYNNYFVMNLVKSKQYTQVTYQPLQTVFLQEQIYQIEAVDNILMGRVYSGVKLFWSSQQVGNPYPYFYRKAGSVFLHNAIQSKLKVINQTKTIFLAAEDQLLKYELRSVDPYVACYSPIEVSQEYKLEYQIECKQLSFMGQENICTQEQVLQFSTWEHKEVKVGAHIFPFLLSLAGVLLVFYAVFRIYKKYNKEVDQARRRYNIEEGQLSI